MQAVESEHQRDLKGEELVGGVSHQKIDFIQRAAKYLEESSFLVRVADVVGMSLEAVAKLAPDWGSRAVDSGLRRGLEFAVITLPSEPLDTGDFTSLEGRAWCAGYRHSALTGGIGRLCGTLGLCVELPITTCVMLRSIGAVARKYGENLRDPAVRLQCLSLFAMGGPSVEDNEMDSSCFTLRASLNKLVQNASGFLAHTPARELLLSIRNGTAPTLVKFLTKISQRFEARIAEKVVAQTLPVIGPVGDATINVMFAAHFNAVALFHFGLRHLERLHGTERVRAIYMETAGRCRV